MPRLDRVPKWFAAQPFGNCRVAHGTGAVLRRCGKGGALYLEMVLVVFRPRLAFGTALGLLEWKKHRVDLIDSPLELRRTGYSNAKCKLAQERRVNMIAFQLQRCG